MKDKQEKVLTLILVKSGIYQIAIHVFQQRGDFLFIRAPVKAVAHIKWFNDINRAMQMLV